MNNEPEVRRMRKQKTFKSWEDVWSWLHEHPWLVRFCLRFVGSSDKPKWVLSWTEKEVHHVVDDSETEAGA